MWYNRSMSKGEDAGDKAPSSKPRRDERVSLAPLSLEDALRALLETDPEPVREGMKQLREHGKKRQRKADTKKAAPPNE